ncbi:Putative salt-induced outer membrane protein [Bordetella ansorpii]|uniref:Putative salt-induced outer membrane protein n=2 Tax=Bordetella ansorpii TaxID=288768 RepID=A0A157RBG3_9BORD|nr:Putative salt-induced outer membrane protein [Bordetella ansorpii]
MPYRNFNAARLPASALLCLLASAAHADTVWLKNGDRISGTVRSLDAGKLLISTEYGGDVRIAADKIKTLQTDGDLVLRDQTFGREYRASLAPANPGAVAVRGVVTEDGASEPVDSQLPLSSLDGLVRPRPFLTDAMWTGRADISANRKTASTETQDYAVALQAGLRHGLWRHTLKANYARSKEEDSVNTNNYGVDYTLDRFLSKQAFWQGRVLHRRDWVEELNRQTGYGTGPGYQFWDDERGAFSMSALFGRIHYGYDDGSSDNSYAASLRWDYLKYFSGKQYEIYARGELTRPFGGAAEVSVSGEMGARYNLNNWLSLYAKYARNQVSSSRESINESIFGTGLGVRW